MEHEFRTIERYPKYEINTWGVIRNIVSKKKIEPLKRNINSYECYSLLKYGKKIKETTNDLLNETFTDEEIIGIPEEKEKYCVFVTGQNVRLFSSNCMFQCIVEEVDETYVKLAVVSYDEIPIENSFCITFLIEDIVEYNGYYYERRYYETRY